MLMQGSKLCPFVLAAALAAVVVTAGCARDSGPARPDGPMLVLAIDGADWNVMRPLLERGELPNLSALIEQGASGPLRSLEPLRRSPVIWTAIATGKSPEENGVGGAPPEGGVTQDASAYTSNMWASSAFWDVAGRSGLRVAVVGWLVTWPAWEVNGAMVSDHIHHLDAYARAAQAATLTYPPELCAQVAPLVRTTESVTVEELSRFVDMGSELGLASLEGNNGTVLRTAISGDETVAAIALSLFDAEPPDVSCVYVRGVDEASHVFWIHTDPATRPPADQSKPGTLLLEKQARALGKALPEYYRYADEIVGRLLSRFPPTATIVVCSDHGFRGPGPWGSGRPFMGEEQHALDGVIIMKGPGIAPGTTLCGATVYDVAPTVLALAGLPVGRDLEGRVLVEAFSREFARRHRVRYVDSNDTGARERRSAPAASPADEEIQERMRSLGYIR